MVYTNPTHPTEPEELAERGTYETVPPHGNGRIAIGVATVVFAVIGAFYLAFQSTEEAQTGSAIAPSDSALSAPDALSPAMDPTAPDGTVGASEPDQ